MTTSLQWLCARETEFSPGRNSSIGLLILRVSLGLTMALGHGWGKLSNFSQVAQQFPDPLGLGSGLSLGLTVFAEFFCSLALIFGVATRAAVIPLIITMATALFMIHGDDPFGKQEKALLYLIPYVAILVAGPGRFAIDSFCCRRKPKETEEPKETKERDGN